MNIYAAIGEDPVFSVDITNAGIRGDDAFQSFGGRYSRHALPQLCCEDPIPTRDLEPINLMPQKLTGLSPRLPTTRDQLFFILHFADDCHLLTTHYADISESDLRPRSAPEKSTGRSRCLEVP